MKKTTKAILASMFLFPGVGQFMLKRPFSGTAFVILALTATVAIVIQTLSIATSIAARITSGEIAPDIMLVRTLVKEQLTNNDAQWVLQGATWLLITVWAVSALDAYRVARNL